MDSNKFIKNYYNLDNLEFVNLFRTDKNYSEMVICDLDGKPKRIVIESVVKSKEQNMNDLQCKQIYKVVVKSQKQKKFFLILENKVENSPISFHVFSKIPKMSQ